MNDNCYCFGSTDDDNLLNRFKEFLVNDTERIDFILAVGLDLWHGNLKDYDWVIRRSVELRFSMIYVNLYAYVFAEDDRKCLKLTEV